MSGVVEPSWRFSAEDRGPILAILLLPLLFVPVVGFALALLIAAHALGAGMIQQTALLRMDMAGARLAWRRNRLSGWVLGLLLALCWPCTALTSAATSADHPRTGLMAKSRTRNTRDTGASIKANKAGWSCAN